MSEIITFISSIGGSALLTAALVFLFRSWISERIKNAIKHEYDAKLETHKAQLRYENNREIEQLKAQLRVTAAERIIRLSGIYEKQAEIIAETYSKLLAFKKTVEDYTQLMPSDPDGKMQHGKNIQSAANDFLEYYLPRKIYFPPETDERIRNLSNAIHSSLLNFKMAMAAIDARIGPEHVEKRWEKLDEVQKEIPALVASLEESFRKILGLDEHGPDGNAADQ